MEVYTNGVLEGRVSNLIAPASQAGTNSAWIGHSPFNDPGINGSVDEYRIYRGRLSPEEITASDVLGPNQTLSTGAPLKVTAGAGSVVMSWPVAAAGFAVEASPDISSASNWSTLTNAPTLSGTNWQLTLLTSGTARFLRLVR